MPVDCEKTTNCTNHYSDYYNFIESEEKPNKKPDGYVFAGFPWEMSSIEHKPVSPHQEKVLFSSELVLYQHDIEG